jgi:hypothetical protein
MAQDRGGKYGGRTVSALVETAFFHDEVGEIAQSISTALFQPS